MNLIKLEIHLTILMISEKEIKIILSGLYQESLRENANMKSIIVKAFAAGQKYQEEKIKYGIEAVFENLYKN